MVIHVMGSIQELLEVLEANGQTDGESNGRPQGVTSSNPIPETEHVGAVNAEFGDLFLVGRKGNKMLGYGLRLERKI